MDRSTALDFAGSIERAAEIVTEGTAFFTPAQLAGQYAFEAARDAGYGTDEETMEAHLEFLREAGATFDAAAAIEAAKAFAGAA